MGWWQKNGNMTWKLEIWTGWRLDGENSEIGKHWFRGNSDLTNRKILDLPCLHDIPWSYWKIHGEFFYTSWNHSWTIKIWESLRWVSMIFLAAKKYIRWFFPWDGIQFFCFQALTRSWNTWLGKWERMKPLYWNQPHWKTTCWCFSVTHGSTFFLRNSCVLAFWMKNISEFLEDSRFAMLDCCHVLPCFAMFDSHYWYNPCRKFTTEKRPFIPRLWGFWITSLALMGPQRPFSERWDFRFNVPSSHLQKDRTVYIYIYIYIIYIYICIHIYIYYIYVSVER